MGPISPIGPRSNVISTDSLDSTSCVNDLHHRPRTSCVRGFSRPAAEVRDRIRLRRAKRCTFAVAAVQRVGLIRTPPRQRNRLRTSSRDRRQNKTETRRPRTRCRSHRRDRVGSPNRDHVLGISAAVIAQSPACKLPPRRNARTDAPCSRRRSNHSYLAEQRVDRIR